MENTIYGNRHPWKRPSAEKTIHGNNHPRKRPSTEGRDHPRKQPSMEETIYGKDHLWKRPSMEKTVYGKNHPRKRPSSQLPFKVPIIVFLRLFHNENSNGNVQNSPNVFLMSILDIKGCSK
jgi:hypothetical protein